MGCFVDFTNFVRDLPFVITLNTLESITIENCRLMCSQNGYKYAGVQNG